MSQLASVATNGETVQQEDLSGPPAANRHRLPDERVGITHHFFIAGHEGYLTVGLYPNGQPGEIFIRMAKEGSTIAGLMECFGTVVSVSLQHGVPLKVLCGKLSHTRFEPSGRAHAMLLDIVIARQAAVVTTAEFAGALPG
jgi:ribonucleoside-diphosphate reductase alpha chain